VIITAAVAMSGIDEDADQTRGHLERRLAMVTEPGSDPRRACLRARASGMRGAERRFGAICYDGALIGDPAIVRAGRP
jgi:hypothetical protein